MSDLPSPKIFGQLDTEISEIAGGQDLSDPIGRFSNLVGFCEEAFSQTLSATVGLDIRGFGERDKASAFASERRLDASSDEPSVALLRIYQQMCDEWPDVLGPEYGGSIEEFAEFRTEFMPELLGILVRCGKTLGAREFARTAEESMKRYESALKENGRRGRA